MIIDIQRESCKNELRKAINLEAFEPHEVEVAMKLLNLMEIQDRIKYKVALQNQEAALSEYYKDYKNKLN